METERPVIMFEGIILRNVHNWQQCQYARKLSGWALSSRTCIIHNPTPHHMRLWRLLWRDDREIFERICPHGIGHPDPDQFDYWREIGILDAYAVHGCDGCCHAPQLRLEEGWAATRGHTISTAPDASDEHPGGWASAPFAGITRR